MRASIVIDHVPGALSVVRNAYLKKPLDHDGCGDFRRIVAVTRGREIAIPHMIAIPQDVALVVRLRFQ